MEVVEELVIAEYRSTTNTVTHTVPKSSDPGLSRRDDKDKARLVIDTVRKKGEAASSDMIEVLCELDPSLCEHLGLE
uniref:CARD domain-containing protein n=1 Tax=Anabas testudineus TaxID=64144 RepID=A0A7N6AL59_ANATE